MALPTQEPTRKLTDKDRQRFAIDTTLCEALDMRLIQIDYAVETGAADVCFHILDRTSRTLAAGLDLEQTLQLHAHKIRSWPQSRIAGHFVRPDR